MQRAITVKTKALNPNYQVQIASGSFENIGNWAAVSLDGPKNIAIVSNKKIFDLYGKALNKSLENEGFITAVHLIGDGERFKNMKTLGTLLDAFSEFGISRSDAVIGFGGGVVGDAAGFAASIYLRGVDFLQVPTSLLAMVDSSVGGKTGVNTPFGKNLAGSFYPPKGVLIDPKVLFTLPSREFRAGLYECVKQAAIADSGLLDQTMSVIETMRPGKSFSENELSTGFESFLAAQIAFKSRIVSGDERESLAKTDARSRKILNFGHTFAHALEKATNYRYLKHGEAVGYGIIFAVSLSKKLGLLDQKVVNLLRDVVFHVGRLPTICSVDPEVVFKALRHDKKNLNRSIQWILLKGIGKPLIVPHKEIGDRLVRQTIKEIISSSRLPS